MLSLILATFLAAIYHDPTYRYSIDYNKNWVTVQDVPTTKDNIITALILKNKIITTIITVKVLNSKESLYNIAVRLQKEVWDEGGSKNDFTTFTDTKIVFTYALPNQGLYGGFTLVKAHNVTYIVEYQQPMLYKDKLLDSKETYKVYNSFKIQR